MISFSTIFDEICSPNKNSVLIKYGYNLPDFLEGSGIELIPQSITTAPCLIQSPGTKFGFPIATTKRSAPFAKTPKSFVFEWHVDVELAEEVLVAGPKYVGPILLEVISLQGVLVKSLEGNP